MRIIALRGPDSCGKSTVLNLVYNNLVPSHAISTNKVVVGNPVNKDFSDIIIYKGLKVAFYTMGDYSSHTITAINHYSALGVDVLIIASNTKFVKPIRLIMSFPHNLVSKTISKPVNAANNLVANTLDATIILGII